MFSAVLLSGLLFRRVKENPAFTCYKVTLTKLNVRFLCFGLESYKVSGQSDY